MQDDNRKQKGKPPKEVASPDELTATKHASSGKPAPKVGSGTADELRHGLSNKVLGNVNEQSLESYKAAEFVFGKLDGSRRTADRKRPTLTELQRLVETHRLYNPADTIPPSSSRRAENVPQGQQKAEQPQLDKSANPLQFAKRLGSDNVDDSAWTFGAKAASPARENEPCEAADQYVQERKFIGSSVPVRQQPKPVAPKNQAEERIDNPQSVKPSPVYFDPLESTIPPQNQSSPWQTQQPSGQAPQNLGNTMPPMVAQYTPSWEPKQTKPDPPREEQKSRSMKTRAGQESLQSKVQVKQGKPKTKSQGKRTTRQTEALKRSAAETVKGNEQKLENKPPIILPVRNDAEIKVDKEPIILPVRHDADIKVDKEPMLPVRDDADVKVDRDLDLVELATPAPAFTVGSTILDLAIPDFAIPDLAIPDLAIRDLDIPAPSSTVASTIPDLCPDSTVGSTAPDLVANAPSTISDLDARAPRTVHPTLIDQMLPVTVEQILAQAKELPTNAGLSAEQGPPEQSQIHSESQPTTQSKQEPRPKRLQRTMLDFEISSSHINQIPVPPHRPAQSASIQPSDPSQQPYPTQEPGPPLEPPNRPQHPEQKRSSADNQQDPPESSRKTDRDPGKTELIKLPEAGAVRSHRGTIEMVVQKTGRILTPEYSATGILKSVTTNDGHKFVMSPDRKTWCIVDRCGDQVNTEPIKSVYFDKKGNFIYVSESGSRTTMYLDGTTAVE